MKLRYETLINSPRERVFAWHTNVAAFRRLSPPWRPAELKRHDGVEDGSRAVLKIPAGPLTMKWVARHEDVRPPEGFVDVQVKGPFRKWRHEHRFEQEEAGVTRLIDELEVEAPRKLRLIGRGNKWMKGEIDRLFAFRQFLTRADCDAHYRLNPQDHRLRVLVTGGTGFIGSAVVEFLRAAGHEVLILTRDPKGKDPSFIKWNPSEGMLDGSKLEGLDAVIHLAGENFLGPWTETKRMAIYGSRIHGTELLSRTLAGLSKPPKVFLSASQIGYYGSRGDEVLTEESDPGDQGFFAYVTRDWERATQPAEEAGIRTVHLRTGLVLNPAGGALALALPFYRASLGMRITGREIWLSWVALNDLVHVMWHLMWDGSIAGPVNVVAPKPVTMAQFTRALRSILRRPAPIIMPERVARLVGGTSFSETVLLSQNVHPERLLNSGYDFLLPDLESALRFQLGKNTPQSPITREHAQV